MLLLREGASNVGLHFIAGHAVFFPRGWMKALEMIDDGPKKFALYINNVPVASTTTGTLTRENFDADVLRDLDEKTPDHDLFAQLPERKEYFNLSFQARIHIVADSPPDRQNYYMKQTWAQLFRLKEGASSNTDMDFEEIPCIQLFNLRAEDASSVIFKTTPVPQ